MPEKWLKPRPESGLDCLIYAILLDSGKRWRAPFGIDNGADVDHKASARYQEQIVVSNRLDLYHKPPDSGERQYKSRI